MPNLTFFISTQQMPADDVLSVLTEQATALCLEVLNAALENVHIMYVCVRHGRGHSIFAEMQYRLTPLRTQPAMNDFMKKLDEMITRNTGMTARIRCFGYDASAIYARN